LRCGQLQCDLLHIEGLEDVPDVHLDRVERAFLDVLPMGMRTGSS
jgi:hypothetical protein